MDITDKFKDREGVMRPKYTFGWTINADTLGVGGGANIEYEYIYHAYIPAYDDGAAEPAHVEIVGATITNFYKGKMDAMPYLSFIYLDDEIADIEAEILKHHE